MEKDEFEKIISKIVVGQLRSFCNDHPEIAESVEWYKPRSDKIQTFINSASKRILRDLLCEETRVRLVRALSGTPSG